MNKSESIKNLAVALSKFQSEVNNPKNTANNPFFKSKYAPLDEVINTTKPILAKYGLSYLQSPSGDGQNIIVTTLLMHESGEWIESEPLVLKADKATAQGAGSAITYARRYSLSAILGISSEDDDDGNHASGNRNTSSRASNNKSMSDNSKTIDAAKIKTLRSLATQKGVSEDYISKFKNKQSFEQFTMEEFMGAKEWLEKKPNKH